MKICFAGTADSTHIVNLYEWFSGKGHDVHVISQNVCENPEDAGGKS